MQQPTQKPKYDTPQYTWSEVWLAVITRPSTETFIQILRDTQKSRRRALIWIAVSMTIYLSALTMVGAVQFGIPIGMAIVSILFSIPILAGIGVLGFMIGSWLLHWLAQRLGGVGEYDDFLYANASFNAPLFLITGVMSAFGVSFAALMTNLLLGIFQLVLMGMSLRAVYKLSWQQVSIIIMIMIGLALFLSLLLLTVS